MVALYEIPRVSIHPHTSPTEMQFDQLSWNV